MIVDKLKKLMIKYNLYNGIKVLILLIILLLLAKLFLPSMNSCKTIEGFQTLGYSSYGNQLSLQEPSNQPVYSGNMCTFKFDSVYRIEALTLKFNNKVNTSKIENSESGFNPDNIKMIYIKYEDGNGNMRYIKSSVNSSPPNFYNTTDLVSTTVGDGTIQNYTLRINDIIDENNLAVYTSKIVVVIGDSNNKIDTFVDECNVGYISNFGFWGSSREMLSRKDFEGLSGTLNYRTFATGKILYDENTVSDSYTFTTTTDMLLYGLSLNYVINDVQPSGSSSSENCRNLTNSPFKLSILYNNGLYAGNNFTINTVYTVRNDPFVLNSVDNTEYIIFAQPIIANKLVITVPRVNTINGTNKILQMGCNRLQGYGVNPSTKDINDYQRTVNALLNKSSKNVSLDICPSVDDLVVKQNQAQQICDNLEYQDRVKSEKIRLERNKQYLLKLKQQQEQIDQLNEIIQNLDNKRQERSKNADVARVLQYQQQKEIASTVRDLANQRLESQDNNQLYLDLKINSK